jgi:hypothetical protein
MPKAWPPGTSKVPKIIMHNCAVLCAAYAKVMHASRHFAQWFQYFSCFYYLIFMHKGKTFWGIEKKRMGQRCPRWKFYPYKSFPPLHKMHKMLATIGPRAFNQVPLYIRTNITFPRAKIPRSAARTAPLVLSRSYKPAPNHPLINAPAL